MIDLKILLAWVILLLRSIFLSWVMRDVFVQLLECSIHKGYYIIGDRCKRLLPCTKNIKKIVFPKKFPLVRSYPTHF